MTWFGHAAWAKTAGKHDFFKTYISIVFGGTFYPKRIAMNLKENLAYLLSTPVIIVTGKIS